VKIGQTIGEVLHFLIFNFQDGRIFHN